MYKAVTGWRPKQFAYVSCDVSSWVGPTIHVGLTCHGTATKQAGHTTAPPTWMPCRRDTGFNEKKRRGGVSNPRPSPNQALPRNPTNRLQDSSCLCTTHSAIYTSKSDLEIWNSLGLGLVRTRASFFFAFSLGRVDSLSGLGRLDCFFLSFLFSFITFDSEIQF